MSSLTVQCFTGASINPYLEPLARLRIQIFREWPYLYDGDMEYEARYLKTYSHSQASLFVLVFDGSQLVGASTGVPMSEGDNEFKEPLLHSGYDAQQLFYFGESVLLDAYRGQGLGVRFFHERERYARELGRFTHTLFCAVERPLDHPRRPANDRSLEGFWNRRGYTKQPHLKTYYVWKDVDETAPTPKPMIFWLKAL